MSIDTVTVVITTRQRAEVLPRAVRSALEQIHEANEIIVVVDGHDEATAAYLNTVNSPSVRTIMLTHQVGGCAARNIGVEAASSKWVAFLDDDDEWAPEKLQTQVAMATRSKVQYPVIACRVAAVTPEGQSFRWPKRRPMTGQHLSDYLLVRDTLTQGEGLITTSMILAPRELLIKVPFKAGLRRHQEWDWLLRASASREVDIKIAWDVLATWNIEGKTNSISKMDQWQASFDWIISMKRLVTPRAYASFLMVFVSAIAAREGDSSAFFKILAEARKNGHPQPIEYLLMAAMWLLPQGTRRKLRNLLLPQVQTA